MPYPRSRSASIAPPELVARLEEVEGRLADVLEAVERLPDRVAGVSSVPSLLSILEVAARLGVSRSTVEALVEAGDLPAPIKVGRQRRWARVTIETWILEGGTR